MYKLLPFILQFQLVFHTTEGKCGQKSVMEHSEDNLVISLFSLTFSNFGEHSYNLNALDVDLDLSNGYLYTYNAITIDVCDNPKVLIENLLPYLNMNVNKPLAIISYMSFDMTRIAASMLSTSDIPFFAFTNQSMFPNALLENKRNFFSFDLYETNYAETMVKSMIDAKVTAVDFYVLCNGSLCAYDGGIENFAKMRRMCVNTYFLDLANENIFNKSSFYLETQQENVLSILIVNSDFLYLFNSKTDYRFGMIYNAQMERDNLEIEVPCDYYESSFVVDWKHKINCSHVTVSSTSGRQSLIRLIDTYVTDIETGLTFDGFRKSLDFGYIFFSLKDHLNTTQHLTNYQSCIMPSCGLGMVANYGEVSSSYTWMRRAGWYCDKCNASSFKDTDEGVCHPCPSFWQSNRGRTMCFDPYEDKFLSMKDTESQLIVTVSVIMLFLNSITIAILYRNRHTPIVVSSGRNISFLQLVVISAMNLCIPLIFIGRPTTTSCIFQPIIIGVFFTIQISITMSRTQKLLFIFQRRQTMGKTEIFVTKATDIIFLIVVLLVDDFLLLTSFKVIWPTQKMDLDHDSISRNIYCNTNPHIQIQLGYIFILLVCNTVQAFRARRLPENYRETVFITFSSFISTLILASTSFIYYSQMSNGGKTLVLVYTVVTINAASFFSLYGCKVFLILFKPEANTEVAFREGISRKLSKERQNLSLS